MTRTKNPHAGSSPVGVSLPRRVTLRFPWYNPGVGPGYDESSPRKLDRGHETVATLPKSLLVYHVPGDMR